MKMQATITLDCKETFLSSTLFVFTFYRPTSIQRAQLFNHTSIHNCRDIILGTLGAPTERRQGFNIAKYIA
jgi:hypothetical protein